jgi:hypothetical protein
MLRGSVSGSGSGRVSGSGSSDFMSRPGSSDFVSGSGSCHHLPDVSVETLRQDVGFQKRRFTATSNRGENVTPHLVVVSLYVVEPDAPVGAGLANNLLEIKRLTAADVTT